MPIFLSRITWLLSEIEAPLILKLLIIAVVYLTMSSVVSRRKNSEPSLAQILSAADEEIPMSPRRRKILCFAFADQRFLSTGVRFTRFK